MRFDLVMFDLDGTLIDTAAEIADAVNRWLIEREREPLSEREVRNWIGHGTGVLLHRVAAARELGEPDAAARAAFAQHYLATCGTQSRCYAGVPQILAQLRAEGTRLAVVTNKESRFTLPILEAHALRERCDLIVCGDTLSARKPDPLPLQHCMQQLGARLERSLFVGDSAIDVQTARNAGVRIWAVPYGYNSGDPIEAARPDRVIPDLTALLETCGAAA